ncbi:MAG: sulfopyruvate decarboxylase subunit beta [Candidatus Omnitrophica bacterium]|nr:sulfopyruvate decarboxylase subunit beta [Candidatus Omnitrophota bacterium]
MTTREAIEAIAGQLQGEVAVCTTGYTCRDMQAASDRALNFYMIGSMGIAGPIGLGIALSRPSSKVLVLDGDGALLMGLGVLPMAASLRPKNFIHLVLDNEAFVSTGGQPTCSAQIPLDELARSAGYSLVLRAQTREELMEGWCQILRRDGPSFLLVKCQPDSGEPAQRVQRSPEELTMRFMEAMRR